ncbi:MAG: response regulator transcription factor [Varibaculum cambriense]|uniref:response regulator transcription factor n=1 Tax=Varibaculum cambriense TaxID=184870 RepID=UPI00290AB62E|nr:response regulator transcription factor [Varibaculum cambriense]MDU4944945.1 response regulator transcription factor [Varibaculum cambriense]
MTSILVVEDEPGISSFVAKGLTSAGYNVTVVDKGADAISGALGGDYSLIVLDIGLPDMDGFEVLEQIRGQGATLPIIVLTARSSVEDTVSGLEQGADDYMSKPFRFEELLARIRLRLRTAISDDPSNMVQINVGGLHLDLRTRCATIDGEPVELSAREFTMLQAFMEHPDQVLSRSQLLDMVWGYDFDPGSNVVDVYVRYLRRKIGSERIVTVRGMGYRLVVM